MKRIQSTRMLISAAALCFFFGMAGTAHAVAKQESASGLHAPPPAVTGMLEMVSMGLELVGIAVIVLGALVSILFVAKEWHRHDEVHGRYQRFRANLGRSILLGLEFLVAADIIGTVATVPTYESLGLLAIIILIRTFLSFSLETEIQGRFPWREAELKQKPERQA